MKTIYLVKRIFMVIVDFMLMYITASFISGLLFENKITTEQLDQLSEYLSSPQSSLLINDSEFQNLVINILNSNAIIILFMSLCMVLYSVVLTRMLKGTTIAGRIYHFIIIEDKQLPSQTALTLRSLLGYGVIMFIITGFVSASINESNFVTMISVLTFTFIFYFIFAGVNLIHLLIRGYSLVDKISKTRLYMVQLTRPK